MIEEYTRVSQILAQSNINPLQVDEITQYVQLGQKKYINNSLKYYYNNDELNSTTKIQKQDEPLMVDQGMQSENQGNSGSNIGNVPQNLGILENNVDQESDSELEELQGQQAQQQQEQNGEPIDDNDGQTVRNRLAYNLFSPNSNFNKEFKRKRESCLGCILSTFFVLLIDFMLISFLMTFCPKVDNDQAQS